MTLRHIIAAFFAVPAILALVAAIVYFFAADNTDGQAMATSLALVVFLPISAVLLILALIAWFI